MSSKRKETSKLTKHGFLDKIKAAAKSKGGDDENNETETPKSGKNVVENEGKKSPSWGALKDDFMLNPKKVSQSKVSLRGTMYLKNNFVTVSLF